MQRVGNFVAAPGCVQFRVVEMRTGICNVTALSRDDALTAAICLSGTSHDQSA